MKQKLSFSLLIATIQLLGTLALAQNLDAIAIEESTAVDNYYRSQNQLMKDRTDNSIHPSDSCQFELQHSPNFGSRIVYFVNLHMNEMLVSLSGLQSYFNLPKQAESYLRVSLVSHPLCEPKAASLRQDIKKVPNAKVIEQLTKMVQQLNQDRQAFISGNAEPAIRSWSKLLMCLSYVESLTSADSASSERIAQKTLPATLVRPKGVLFYEDPYQDATSRLNIGLFQFTPNAQGNIQSCISEWNRFYPKCNIGKNLSAEVLATLLGSNLQNFNTFCGANKILQTFSVQVNSSSKQNTSVSNIGENGDLRSPANRCVSLQMAAGKAYNHFGPLQNSTGDNLNELVSCFRNSN